MEEQNFEDKEPLIDLDELLIESVHEMPHEFTSYMCERILEMQPYFFQKDSFCLELVIDTNILFQEVRSLAINGQCFLLKIIDNPFFKIYAPSDIKYEIFEKIKIKFPKEKKTRDLDTQECLDKAEYLLSKVEIRDDIDVYSRYRASELLEGRDKDDINFVALNFSLNAHGILTNDKDISDQDELKTWKLKDAGSVITDIHKGSFSFYILSSSIRVIIKILSGIIQSLWKGILAMVNGIIKLGAAILSHSSSAISKMPKEILALFGISIFAILLVKDARERTGEFFSILWDELKKLIKSAKELVGKIWDAFKEFIKSMKPFFEGSYEVVEYLFIQSEIAMKELSRLENIRA